jgi:hypothetical protein
MTLCRLVGLARRMRPIDVDSRSVRFAAALILIQLAIGAGSQARAQAAFEAKVRTVTFDVDQHVWPDDQPIHQIEYEGGPQWKDGDDDGLPDTVTDPPTAAAIDRNFPVHYTSGTPCKVEEVEIEVTSVPAGVTTGTLRVAPVILISAAPTLVFWPLSTADKPFTGIGLYSFEDLVSQVAFTNNLVKKYPALSILWTVYLDVPQLELTARDAVFTGHRVYVTRNPPQVGRLYETLIDTVCTAADGFRAPEDIALAVDAAFQTGSMRAKAKDGWNRLDDRILTYWYPNAALDWRGTGEGFTLASFFKEEYTLNGPARRSVACGGWADFYIQAYGVNDAAQDGIGVQKVTLRPIAPTQTDVNFGDPTPFASGAAGLLAAKPATFVGAGHANPDGFDHLYKSTDSGLLPTLFLSKPAGQGGGPLWAANEEIGTWVDHCIVARTGIGGATYYADPSFAGGVNGTLLDYENYGLSATLARYEKIVIPGPAAVSLLGKERVLGEPRITFN